MAKPRDDDRTADFIAQAMELEEEEDAKAAGTIGFVAWALVQVTMPHRRTKARQHVRRNGGYTLAMTAMDELKSLLRLVPRALVLAASVVVLTGCVAEGDRIRGTGPLTEQCTNALASVKPHRYRCYNSKYVLRMQRSLAAMGFEPGRPSGRFNQRTFKAFQEYLDLRGGEAAPMLGASTVRELELAQEDGFRAVEEGERRPGDDVGLARLVGTCSAVRSRYLEAEREIDRLYFRVLDARNKPGLNPTQIVFSQAYGEYPRHAKVQEEAIAEMRGLGERLRRLTADSQQRELCSSNGMHVRSLTNSSIPRRRPPSRPSAERTAPSIAVPVVSQPSFRTEEEEAVHRHLIKDCSRFGLVLNANGSGEALVTAMMASAIGHRNGYCRSTTLGTSFDLGLGSLRKLECVPTSDSTRACTFEARMYCSMSSVFGDAGDNQKLGNMVCAPVSGGWRPGNARFLSSDGRPLIVEALTIR